MCNKKKACREADAAKRHVGEWALSLDADDAGNVQYVIDEAAAEGIELRSIGEVMLFCLLTVTRIMSARASFDLAPLTGKGADE